MTEGVVYEVRWIDNWSMRQAKMRFEGTHPSGTLMFRYLDGFAFLPLNPGVVMDVTAAVVS